MANTPPHFGRLRARAPGRVRAAPHPHSSQLLPALAAVALRPPVRIAQRPFLTGDNLAVGAIPPVDIVGAGQTRGAPPDPVVGAAGSDTRGPVGGGVSLERRGQLVELEGVEGAAEGLVGVEGEELVLVGADGGQEAHQIGRAHV